MTLVPVSKWLAEEVHYSFLNKQPMKVIYNGIDLDTFKPTESKFKEKHGILGKKIWCYVKITDTLNLCFLVKSAKCTNWSHLFHGLLDNEPLMA